jgi:hypothetical protein
MARGTIIKRRTKTKGVIFDIKYRTADGTQVKQAVGPSKQEAQRMFNEALAAVQRGAQRSTSTETFAEVADRWLERKRPRIEAATYRDYEIHLRKRLKPAFGALKLRQITRAKIEAYLAEQDQDTKLSRKTINDSLIPLRQTFGRQCVEASSAATRPRTTTATTHWSFATSARQCCISTGRKPSATSTPAYPGTARSPRR